MNTSTKRATPKLNGIYVQNGRFMPFCKVCEYKGPSLSDKDIAKGLLKRHKESKTHQTNRVPTRHTL